MKTILVPLFFSVAAALAGPAAANPFLKCTGTFPLSVDGAPHEFVVKRGEYKLFKVDGKRRHQVYPSPSQQKVMDDPKMRRATEENARRAAELTKDLPKPANPCDGIYGFSLNDASGMSPRFMQITIWNGKATTEVLFEPVSKPGPAPEMGWAPGVMGTTAHKR